MDPAEVIPGPTSNGGDYALLYRDGQGRPSLLLEYTNDGQLVARTVLACEERAAAAQRQGASMQSPMSDGTIHYMQQRLARLEQRMREHDPFGPAGACERTAAMVDAQRHLLVVDASALMREIVFDLLCDEPDLVVVGQCSDAHAAVEGAGQLQPDRVIMGIDRPRLDGIEATRRINARWPMIQVIGLSSHDDASVGDRIRAAGAAASLCKSKATEQLVPLIRALAPPP
jgi:CheY-like chemotaxis protein